MSLAENSGLPPIDSMQQVSCFFLSLVKLDIRQEYDRHTDVMDAYEQPREQTYLTEPPLRQTRTLSRVYTIYIHTPRLKLLHPKMVLNNYIYTHALQKTYLSSTLETFARMYMFCFTSR